MRRIKTGQTQVPEIMIVRGHGGKGLLHANRDWLDARPFDRTGKARSCETRGTSPRPNSTII
jgi:hypothetical protein